MSSLCVGFFTVSFRMLHFPLHLIAFFCITFSFSPIFYFYIFFYIIHMYLVSRKPMIHWVSDNCIGFIYSNCLLCAAKRFANPFYFFVIMHCKNNIFSCTRNKNDFICSVENNLNLCIFIEKNTYFFQL